MLSYNGQEGRTIGDAFVGKNQLSIGNIYTGKKVASSSESELGFSISAGLDYSINVNDGRALDLWLGGSWLQDTTYIQNQNGQVKPKTPNFLGGFKYQSRNDFLITGDTLFDNEAEILNAELFSKAQVNDLSLSSRYEVIKAHADERLEEDLETVNLSTSYTGFENFSVSASRRYDLSERAMASSTSLLNMNFSSRYWDYQFSQTFYRREFEKTQISAIYDDDCTRISIIFQNVAQIEDASDSIQSLSLLFQLKPFLD